jgi:hypothetical protein
VFEQLATPVRLNYGALPQYSPASGEDREEYDLTQHEVMRLRLAGIFLAEGLQAIFDHYAPTEDDLVAVFVHDPLVPDPVARSIARAFSHFWRDDPEAACCVALPRVETLVRRQLHDKGVPTFRPQKGQQPGDLSQPGSLLRELADQGLDESWSRSLQAVLVKPGLGINLRNDVLHGLRDDAPDRVETALVLQCALFLLALIHGRRAFHSIGQHD